ncbi:unnamed protein product [Rotaria sp. Silwood1]|nr:unnamed protein product [Rotaria sp. Silwood1]
MIITTLTMLITFFLHCSLENTKANGFIIQIILIDPTYDVLLNTSCLLNKKLFNKNCNYFNNSNYDLDVSPLIPVIILAESLTFWYDSQKCSYNIRPVIYTIINSLLLARFCHSFNICCQFDIFTVYFLIWQIMFLITEWELEKLPFISLSFYRGWLCIMPAFHMYFLYDFFFRRLPIEVNFLYIWLFAIADIIYCLHPKYYDENTRLLGELYTDDTPSLIGFYYTWNFDDDESDQENNRASLGLGDFLIFNHMLLLVLPSASSITTKVYITIGHIIAIQIGLEVTFRLGRFYNQYVQPAVPLPLIFFSLYSILLNAYMEY